MELYLVQHGESKKEDEDPARPLTERGRTEVERVARAVARLRLDVEEIVHSGKLRARETAEILGAHLLPTRGPLEMAGLSPKDDPSAAREAIVKATGPLVVVGHLPHLSRLTSLLVTGDTGKEIVTFRMGAMVCLSGEGPGTDAAAAGKTKSDRAGTQPAGSGAGSWRLRWILTPELAQE